MRNSFHFGTPKTIRDIVKKAGEKHPVVSSKDVTVTVNRVPLTSNIDNTNVQQYDSYRASTNYLLPPLELVVRQYPQIKQELQLLYIRNYLTSIRFDKTYNSAKTEKLAVSKTIARAIAKAYPELKDTCKKQYKLDFQIYFPTLATTPNTVYSRTIDVSNTYWFGDPAVCLSAAVYKKLRSKKLTSHLQACDVTDETWNTDKRCFLSWGSYYDPQAKFVIGFGIKRRDNGIIIAFQTGCGKAKYYTNMEDVKSKSGLLGLVPLTCVEKNQDRGIILQAKEQKINVSLLTNGNIIVKENDNLILECITDKTSQQLCKAK